MPQLKLIIQNLGLNIIEINDDDSFKFYSFIVLENVKKTRPALLCNNRANTRYVPNYLCSSSNTDEIRNFL